MYKSRRHCGLCPPFYLDGFLREGQSRARDARGQCVGVGGGASKTSRPSVGQLKSIFIMPINSQGFQLLFRTIFLLTIQVLFCSVALAQLVLYDSVSFERHQGYLFKTSDGFAAFDGLNGIVKQFDLKGKLTQSTRLDSAFYAKSKGAFHEAIIWIKGDQLILLNTHKYQLDFFNAAGKHLYSKKLGSKFKGERYFVQFGAPPYYAVMKDDILYLEIKKDNWKGYNGSSGAFRNGGKKRYAEPGLVGMFNLNGKLMQVFGQYDPVYRGEKLLTYLDDYHIGLIGKDSVFIQFQLGDQIAIYHKGISKSPFGIRGDCFNMDEDQYYDIKNKSEELENNPKHSINTPHYFDGCSVGGNFFVRSYAIGMEDTVQFTAEALLAKQQWLNGSLKGCLIRGKQDFQQAKEYRSKPCFIQIFDLKNPQTPIFDGPINLRFPICLGCFSSASAQINDLVQEPAPVCDVFLFASYFRAEHGQPDKQTIYYYKLLRSTD